ncbi:MAG: hypothetical protein LBT53_01595, partial [Puniceicoccales bacterium]|nr:hypothetical protein [Puniceicoccales bacterium]
MPSRKKHSQSKQATGADAAVGAADTGDAKAVHQPEDKLVQDAMDDLPTVAALLKAYLPASVAAKLDLAPAHLRRVRSKFVTQRLKTSEA